MKNLCKKLVTLVILVNFSFAPIIANAQWVVWDPGNFVPNAITAEATLGNEVKEFGLDAVAWVLINLIINRLAASTVQWINSGFRGSPAFVTDPAAYFQDIGDKVAGQFILSNPNLNFLCGPLSARIKIALAKTYTRDNIRWQCSLTDAIGNIDDFMNDFERGGWDKFFKLTQERQNNPLGAYIQAEGELFERLAEKIGQKQKELDWGDGFMSFEVCGEEGRDEDGTCIGKATIETPGSVISDRLNSALNLGNDKLAVADELNEIVGALLNQLVTQALGGLRSLGSRNASNNNGPSLVEQLANSSAASTTDYFGNTQNTQILTRPLPNIGGGIPTNPLYPTGSGTPPFCDPSDLVCICQNEPNRTECEEQNLR